MKIDVTKWFSIKSDPELMAMLAINRKRLITCASAAQLLAKANRLEPFKASHIARIANRFDQYHSLANKDKIYLSDAIRIIALAFDELLDEIIHPYNINKCMKDIEIFMQFDATGQLFFSEKTD